MRWKHHEHDPKKVDSYKCPYLRVVTLGIYVYIICTHMVRLMSSIRVSSFDLKSSKSCVTIMGTICLYFSSRIASSYIVVQKSSSLNLFGTYCIFWMYAWNQQSERTAFTMLFSFRCVSCGMLRLVECTCISSRCCIHTSSPPPSSSSSSSSASSPRSDSSVSVFGSLSGFFFFVSSFFVSVSRFLDTYEQKTCTASNYVHNILLHWRCGYLIPFVRHVRVSFPICNFMANCPSFAN